MNTSKNQRNFNSDSDLKVENINLENVCLHKKSTHYKEGEVIFETSFIVKHQTASPDE